LSDQLLQSGESFLLDPWLGDSGPMFFFSITPLSSIAGKRSLHSVFYVLIVQTGFNLVFRFGQKAVCRIKYTLNDLL